MKQFGEHAVCLLVNELGVSIQQKMFICNLPVTCGELFISCISYTERWG